MSKARILVVEDEGIIAQDLQSTLIQYGYDVPLIVDSTEKVIEAIHSSKPNLVLMDIRINDDLDGVDIAEIISNKYNIPIVFLTAYTDEETLGRAKLSESYGLLMKPFHEKELLITLEFALHNHKSKKNLIDTRNLFESILKSIPQGVISTDKTGYISYLNPSAKKIFNVTDFEAKNKGLNELFTLDKDYLTTKVGPKKIKLKDKSEMWVELNVSPLDDSNGEMIGKIYIIEPVEPPNN